MGLFRNLAVAVMASAAIASSAAACLPAGPRGDNTAHDYATFAHDMVRQAAHVEIVQVEGASPITDPGLWRQWLARQMARQPQNEWAQRYYDERKNRPVGVRFRLRVLERLKGAGPDVYGLDGSELREPMGQTGPRRPFQHWGGPTGPRTPFAFMEPEELSVANLTQMTSCDAPAIAMVRGARYLVFRGGDGHLLGPIRFKGAGRAPSLGYRLEILTPGGPEVWLAVVRRAVAADQRKSHRPAAR